MRPIHVVRLEKVRPALVLTRAASRGAMGRVTVAPITSRVRGLAVEVAVGPENGLGHESVVNCDNVETVELDRIGRFVGFLHPDQETALAKALAHAFDLRIEDLPRGGR